jgi:phospholipid/cholesterol/gamma-HCH transport system substrate-binding protein
MGSARTRLDPAAPLDAEQVWLMLTRFVRIQLVVFTILSIVGVVVMVFDYLQAPTLLGIGRITVALDLPTTGGLYRFSNVTYRGLQIGKVTKVGIVRNGTTPRVRATLSLADSPRVPADLVAEVHSVSAIGELYVDLEPRTASAPYLHDGSVIAAANTKLPPRVGPMLDKLSALVDSIPKQRLGDLLDESFKAFNGAGPDVESLVDSSSKLAADLNGVAERTGTLIEDAVPLLDSQLQTTDAIRRWTHSLAGVTDQVVANDSQIRLLLNNGPDAADEATRLLDQVRPTLPVLLANLTTIGQVGVIYHPSLEQLLVILPPVVSYTQASGGDHNPTGIPVGDFRLSFSDPPGCTVGFLPPSSWRSPADETTVDTPDDLYCKLPQDSPILARGARNLPCMGVPGKRAPTVRECYSNKPYTPLAMRPHVLGPYPLDPNLLSQGIPPDYRVREREHLIGPPQGTPLPPGVAPAPAGPVNPVVPPGLDIAPIDQPDLPAPATSPQPTPPRGAPSAFHPDAASASPSAAITQYDPQTGRFATPSGQVLQQTNLVTGPPKTWKDLIFRTAS